jgi:hypothetical protein
MYNVNQVGGQRSEVRGQRSWVLPSAFTIKYSHCYIFSDDLLSRYATINVFPSQNVIYSTSGNWNTCISESKFHASLTANLRFEKNLLGLSLKLEATLLIWSQTWTDYKHDQRKTMVSPKQGIQVNSAKEVLLASSSMRNNQVIYKAQKFYGSSYNLLPLHFIFF